MDLALLEAVTRNEATSRRMFIDILEVATRLERNYGHYFKPYSGEQLFFEYSSSAVLDFGKNKYYSIVEKDPLNPGETMPVALRSQQDLLIWQDVYDQHERIVVRGKDVGKLRSFPVDPVRMLNFIDDYVKDYCQTRIPAFENQGRGIEKILDSDYLSAEFLEELYTINPKLKPEEKQKQIDYRREFYNEIFHLVEPTLASIREFMGPNKWTIFTTRRSSYDLIIEAFIDYRIYVYHKNLKDEHEQRPK